MVVDGKGTLSVSSVGAVVAEFVGAMCCVHCQLQRSDEKRIASGEEEERRAETAGERLDQIRCYIARMTKGSKSFQTQLYQVTSLPIVGLPLQGTQIIGGEHDSNIN